jgi:hypothetical protein
VRSGLLVNSAGGHRSASLVACQRQGRCPPTAVEIVGGDSDEIAVEDALADEVVEKTRDLFGLLPAAIRALLRQRLEDTSATATMRASVDSLPADHAGRGSHGHSMRFVMKSRPLGDLLQAGHVSQYLVGLEGCAAP